MSMICPVKAAKTTAVPNYFTQFILVSGIFLRDVFTKVDGNGLIGAIGW
jgi:hypothetical protein